MEMQGKTVVLTGAAGGIGRAFGQALANVGAKLILVSRNRASLDSMLAALSGSGHQAVLADLATDGGRQAVVDACRGGVDALINTAGINHFGLLETQTEAQIREMFEVNTFAPILLIQALIPLLSKRPSVIVNVGSGFGSIGFAGFCGYSASKFALHGFTEALRRELADSSIKVAYLAPRATATAMNSAAVMAMNKALGNAVDSPEQVAAELMVLLEKNDRARYLGWPERFFIKLNGLLPALVDRALAKQLPIIRKQAVVAASQDS